MTSEATVAKADPSAQTLGVRADFLFESVICDLHVTALSVGAFATMLGARAREGAAWTLKGWRSVLTEDGQSMQLTLRFRADFGLSAATSAQIARLYAEIAEAKSADADWAERLGVGDAIDKPALSRAAERWRHLCRQAARALKDVAPETRRRLPPPYDADARTLIGFLALAEKGDTRRVSPCGEIELPQLLQRRRGPRVAARRPCTLLLPGGGRARAEIENLSRDGVGLRCQQPLREGQEIVVELSGGRRLVGVVVRLNGERAGLRLATPLAPADPLFQAAAGAA